MHVSLNKSHLVFQNISSSKEFLVLPVLAYLANLEWGMGLAFCAQFLHTFSIKMFLFNTLSIKGTLMEI